MWECGSVENLDFEALVGKGARSSYSRRMRHDGWEGGFQDLEYLCWKQAWE